MNNVIANERFVRVSNYFDNVTLDTCSIKLYAFCRCEQSEAVSCFARGLLRRKERSSQ